MKSTTKENEEALTGDYLNYGNRGGFPMGWRVVGGVNHPPQRDPLSCLGGRSRPLGDGP